MDRSSFQIRAMRVDDASSVQELSKQLGYSPRVEDVSARIASIQNHPDHFLRVATDRNAKIVAWVHGCTEIPLEAQSYVRVTALVVDATHRGQGIGRQLMANLEHWTIDKGISLVSLRSQIRREEAHRFYERLGYEKTKTSFKFEKDLDQAEMIKSIAMVARSIEDIKANRTQPAKQAMEEIAAELGLKLERRPAAE
jgi:GNAT superfamily N-acetyltransferase